MFESGSFPQNFKNAIITPVPKKLSASTLNGLRPVSGLSFSSKTAERAIAAQLHCHLSTHDLYPSFQSAYRCGHSVETALTFINDSFIKILDSGQCVLLVLLDLSAAFDTVDHNILTQILEHKFSICGKALSVIKSYLEHRTFQVKVNNNLSSTHSLPHGVPQGSILGPLLFTLYTSSLTSLLSELGLSFHLYADDTQLWTSVNIDDPLDIANKLSLIEHAMTHIENWMHTHRLKLNTDKTDFMLIYPNTRRKAIPNISLNLNGTILHPHDKVRNLGFIFDKNLSCEVHLSNVIKSCYYHLRNIAAIKKYLTKSHIEILVHSFITSKLDFCNSLFSAFPLKFFNIIIIIIIKSSGSVSIDNNY